MDAHLKATNPHPQYAPVNSPVLTGTPKAPTAAPGTNNTQMANTAFVQAALAALAGGAPEALDTLKELADALGGDANFSTTVLNRLAGKMDIAKNGSDIASVPDFLNNLGLGSGSALPVGVPVPWPLATPPVGWFRCNGATFSATAYPQLAKAYPSLKLPDLRGEFIRGWDGGRNVDAGRELLSWQKGSYLLQEALANVDRVVQFSVNDIGLLGWDATENNGDAPRARSTADSGISTWNATARGGTGMQYLGYSRPRNIAFNYIVRAA